MAPDVLPGDARLIALMIASTPSITDAQPAVLNQLLEFAQRYTAQVLGDALVYSEHAGRGGIVDEEDVKLAVQSRIGWEFGGRVPKEYLLSLATKTNAKPLPAVSEVFGIRLPPTKNTLTAVDFDLIPNKPPPGVKLLEDEDEDEDDEDYGDDEDGGADGDLQMADNLFAFPPEGEGDGGDEPADDFNQADEAAVAAVTGADEEGDDLFGEEDEDEEMAELGDGGLDLPAADGGFVNGISAGEKRKLDDDDDDYDA